MREPPKAMYNREISHSSRRQFLICKVFDETGVFGLIVPRNDCNTPCVKPPTSESRSACLQTDSIIRGLWTRQLVDEPDFTVQVGTCYYHSLVNLSLTENGNPTDVLKPLG